ncbi:MAG: tRNA (guanosine(46)-N7)-methyltransferase TrmB [Flavipsychrobacter sp.]|nr:tRNA (guanosine(46)-N7)-methyltransferase TrmB [Flavipsychrobacter sp.]
MGHKKLIRFNAIGTFPNVLQEPKDVKGRWNEVFENNNPVTLELACGKGEYSVGLGREHAGRNYIGVDIKGNRIYAGAKIALNEPLPNVRFLRTQIGHITEHFAPGEVSEIWIIFPDPFLRDSRAKNRLTHARFLHLYQQILKPGSIINLKTDSRELYDFTKEVIAEQNCTIKEDIVDIYGQGKATGPLAIQTFYEKMHLAEGRTIYYIAFQLPDTEIVLPERYKKNARPVERD